MYLVVMGDFERLRLLESIETNECKDQQLRSALMRYFVQDGEPSEGVQS